MITLENIQRGYEAWAAKARNAKWVRKIDGTPIANDIVVNIFEAIRDAPPAPSELKLKSEIEKHCVEVADRVEPGFRVTGQRSCTGHYAKRWQAAYDAALLVLTEADIPSPADHAVASIDDDAECCIVCEEPLEDGDMVYWENNDTGHIHAACCGPERESYVNADGEPLKDGEPIPAPFAWRAGR